MKFNYHTHSTYSDGKNTIEQLAKTAIEQKFDILGISDHGYVPFPSKWNAAELIIEKYFAEIMEVEKKFEGKIMLLKGIEADYVENLCDINPYKKYDFDYIIGSVHYFPLQFENGKYFNFDTTEKMFLEGLRLFFGNNVEKMVVRYFENIMEMIETSTPDIVGHLDIIGKFNLNKKYYDEQSANYIKIIDKVLDTIKKYNVVMEVNARRKYRNFHTQVSPTTNVIEMALKKDISITISGDVHYMEELSMYWDETFALVKDIGYRELYYRKGKKWEVYKI